MNAGTILVGVVLLIIVGGIVLKLVREKKQGKSSCGCGCDCCPNAGACHSPSDTPGKGTR